MVNDQICVAPAVINDVAADVLVVEVGFAGEDPDIDDRCDRPDAVNPRMLVCNERENPTEATDRCTDRDDKAKCGHGLNIGDL